MLLMDIQVKLQTEEIIYLEANKNQAMCLLTYFQRIFGSLAVRKNVRVTFSRPKKIMKGNCYVF